ncbi:hypothetical protein BC936DRAFT_145031, partial [Jimgerdemannia flammicorona]
MAAAMSTGFSEAQLQAFMIFGQTEAVANPTPDLNLVDANLYSFQDQFQYELSVYAGQCSAIATTPDIPSQGQVPNEYPDQYSTIALATPDILSQIPLMEPHLLMGPNPPMGPNLYAKPYTGATYQAIQDQVHTTSTGQPSCGFKHYSPDDEEKTEDKRKNKKQRTEVKLKSKKPPSCINCYNTHKACVKKVKYKKCERCERKCLECDNDTNHRITRSSRKSPKVPTQLNENEGSQMLPEEPQNVINFSAQLNENEGSRMLSEEPQNVVNLPAQLNENEGSRMLPEEPQNVINFPAQLNETEGSRMLPEEPQNVINSLEAPSKESQNVIHSSEVLQADEPDDYIQLKKYINSSLMKDIEDVVNERGVALMALDENGMPVFDLVVLDLIYPNVNTSNANNRRESD